jgi:tetratricopeptide (TPR) repeat protein
LKLERCHDPGDSVSALLLQRIGALHFLQKDFKNGIRYTKLSMNVITGHRGEASVNPAHLIKSYNNLRICYDALGEFKNRDEAIDSCISLMVRLKAGYDYGVPLMYTKARSIYESGDYFKCIDYCTVAEEINLLSGVSVDDHWQYVIWRSGAMQYIGRFQETEGPLLSAVAELKKGKAEKYLGSVYGLLARLYEEKEDLPNSLKYVRLSIASESKFGLWRNCASALNNLGYFLYFKKMHAVKLALACHAEALRYADAMEALNTYDLIGNEYSSLGKLDSALHYYQLAFDRLGPGVNETTLVKRPLSDFSDSSVTEYVTSLILDKAYAYVLKFRRGGIPDDIQEAKRIYRTADLVLERLKAGQSESKSWIFWRKNTRQLYEHALEACYLSSDMTMAYYFSERSRAVLLLDQLEEQRTLKNDQVARQFEWKSKLNRLERELASGQGDPERDRQLRQAILQVRNDLDQLDREVMKQNPILFGAIMDSSGTRLADFQHAVLKEKDLLLELFTGDSAVYALYVDRTHAKMSQFPRSYYDAVSGSYQAYLSDKGKAAGDYPGFLNASRSFHQLLFGGMDASSFDRLVVSPDGPIIPLESLVANSGPGQPIYLLEKAAVSYTFSARFLMQTGEMESRNSAIDFLGMAPVRYPEFPQLSELIGSDISVDRILGNFRSEGHYYGKDATRARFFDDFRQARIAQLYTHGSDSSDFNEPVIYFSDSSVLLSDLLYKERSSTKLVVLSACRTGLGKLNPGEGVFSFSRGFAALGIPSSMTNLWSVENEATYKITESFYGYLGKGLPLDVALQRAKLDYLASETGERRLPYFWAAQIMSGRTDPILVRKPWPLRSIALVAGAFMLFLSLAWWIRRKNVEKRSSA